MLWSALATRPAAYPPAQRDVDGESVRDHGLRSVKRRHHGAAIGVEGMRHRDDGGADPDYDRGARLGAGTKRATLATAVWLRSARLGAGHLA